MHKSEEIKDLDKVEPIDHGVIAKPHTPVYKMHRYFARRPYTVFNELIHHYSNPGSIVLDPMCGGGVTMIEGLRLKRKVIGVDLDPMAIFITKMEAIDIDLDEFKQAFWELSDKVKNDITNLYLTKCPKCNKEVPADWFEWSNVVECPKCHEEIIFAQVTKLKAGTYECPHCGETVKALKGKRKSDKIVRLKLKCDCRFKLVARTTEGRAYYCCSSKSRNNRPKICSPKNIRGDSLEAAVWDSVSRLLSRPELIMEQLKNRGQANPSAYLEANLDRLSHALGRKKVEADRMLDAYKIGAIDLQTLKQKMDEIKNEKAGLNEEKLRLEKELHKAKTQELNEEKLYQFCQSLPATLANLNFEDKRQILREVIDKIVVDGNELTIYGVIPLPEEKAGEMSVGLQSS